VLLTVIYQPIVDVLYVAQEESGTYANQARIRVTPRSVSLPESTLSSILTYEAHAQERTYSIVGKLYRNSYRLLDTWALAKLMRWSLSQIYASVSIPVCWLVRSSFSRLAGI